MKKICPECKSENLDKIEDRFVKGREMTEYFCHGCGKIFLINKELEIVCEKCKFYYFPFCDLKGMPMKRDYSYCDDWEERTDEDEEY